MKKLLILIIAFGSLSVLIGCKSNQKIVENVRYVHDTAFYRHDSIINRYLTFSGTEEEKTAEWINHDSATGKDTVIRYRWRTIKSETSENTHAESNGSSHHSKKDTTAITTSKVKDCPAKAHKGRLPWIISIILLIACISLGYLLWMKKSKIKR